MKLGSFRLHIFIKCYANLVMIINVNACEHDIVQNIEVATTGFTTFSEYFFEWSSVTGLLLNFLK